MTEKPILFSGPMVRAILDGTKTQTRRTLKPSKKYPNDKRLRLDVIDDPRFVWWWDGINERVGHSTRVPYTPGDRLWVRETWAHDGPDLDACRRGVESDGPSGGPYYKATARKFDIDSLRWRPSIHMPRWASRITLLVTDVRVERLQDIGGGDAMAEGVGATEFWTPKELESRPFEEKWWDDYQFWQSYPPIAFARLWDSINAKRPGCSWDDNPWVAAITFERVTP